MSVMMDQLHHIFLPRPSNNYRAKILHHSVLLSFLILVLSITVTLPTWVQSFPQILGTSVDITSQKLLDATNKKRAEKGLSPLKMNTELAKAASEKANYMFSKNFWAHNAPDGTTPWVFIKATGYEYTYAGENLARGFTSTDDVVKAWMESPTHRENMLSGNYEDIGFAIEQGTLNGEDTILVVEMLGNKSLPVAQNRPLIQQAFAGQVGSGSGNIIGAITSQPLLTNSVSLKDTTLFILIVFILTLFIDMIVIERKKVVRLISHNLDHILFLSLIGAFIWILQRGHIL